jgi:hypothetical protein
MTNKNFDFLGDKNKIELAKNIEQTYWNCYFNCDDWSVDDIDFHLRLKYMFGDDVILTMDEYNKIFETIVKI